MTDGERPVAPPFSRPLSRRQIAGFDRAPQSFEATEQERAALAGELELLGLDRLSVEAIFAPADDGWALEATVRAHATQSCVVTLAPVEVTIEETARRLYLPADRIPDETEVDIDPEAEDPPEPLGPVIDVGAVAGETLALALEPYPRAPGVVFEGRAAGPPDAEPLTDEGARPFAGLAELKKRMERGE